MFHIVVCFYHLPCLVVTLCRVLFYPLPCFVVTPCRVLLLPFVVFCCYPLPCFVVTLCRVLFLPFAVFCCYPLPCLVVTLCCVLLLPFAVFSCYPLSCFVSGADTCHVHPCLWYHVHVWSFSTFIYMCSGVINSEMWRVCISLLNLIDTGHNNK